MCGGPSFPWRGAFHCTVQHKSSHCSMCPPGRREAMEATAEGGLHFPQLHTLFYRASKAVRKQGSALPDWV